MPKYEVTLAVMVPVHTMLTVTAPNNDEAVRQALATARRGGQEWQFHADNVDLRDVYVTNVEPV